MKQLAPGSRLVVASHNPGKVWEIKELIAPMASMPFPQAISTSPSPRRRSRPSTATRAESPRCRNRLGPARARRRLGPGSRRPRRRTRHLLRSLGWSWQVTLAFAMQRVHDALAEKGAWDGTPPRANFISVLCLAWPTGEHRLFEGRAYGTLHWPPRGGNGFGYDPMFAPDGETRTFGEMEPAAKYAISHRTRLRSLQARLA